VGPALHHVLGDGVAGLGFAGDVVEEVEHQERLFERSAGHGGHLGVVEQFNERVHVVAAHHGAQQLGGFGLGDQAHLNVAVGDCRQKAGLDLGRIVHARGHAVGDQVHEELALACGWALEQLNHLGHLAGRQRQRGNAEGGALGRVGAVGLQKVAHGNLQINRCDS
jgi:hypothetical protein